MTFPRLSLSRLLLAIGGLACAASIANAQDTTAFSKRRADSVYALGARGLWAGARTPVLLSFSGGISLGAYQAGVNWVMLELIKASHYRGRPGSLARVYPMAALPEIPVTAMSGASAGNINVLLASVAYCDERLDQPAEESLFWKMWVQSGWDELFPEHSPRGNDPGALDRSAAMARVKHSVDSAMTNGQFDPRCRMPLGVSVTRIHPVPMDLSPVLSYRTQRMAALFTTEAAGGRLRFVRQPRELLLARPLGAQIVLPVDTQQQLSIDNVFDVVMASSSYPIAFAPVPIRYQLSGCVVRPGCVDADTAKFMDGGVFDNNPVSLVVGMADALRAAAPLPGTERSRVWFVDPDAARPRTLRAARIDSMAVIAKRDTQPDPNGVGALLSFVGGFVPSARQYELQAFARSQAALPATEQAAIMSSVRSHPVIGEHLNAFAAFLGTPFRQFDFYAGVADGMRFVAREVLCRESLPWRLDPSLEARVSRTFADSGADNAILESAVEECERQQARRLAESAFRMSDEGRHIVQRVMARDFSSLPASTPGPNANPERLAVLTALEEATWAKLHQPLPAPGACRRGPFLTRALCADGFAGVLDSLRSHKDAMRVLRCERGSSGCTPYPDPVEQTAHLVDDPRGTLDKYLTLALIEVRRTERSERSGWFRAMKVGEMVYRAADDHHGWSYDGGPSSIPRQDLPWSTLAAFPYFAGPTVGVRGYQFGWQPTLHTPLGGLILEVPFGATGIPRGVEHSSGVTTSAFATPSVGLELRNGYVNQFAIGARAQTTGSLRSDLGGKWISTELSGYILGRVLRWNVYQLPWDMSESGRSRKVWGISLADVNGMAYWIMRRP